MFFFKFYRMTDYQKVEIELLNIQIGCLLRHARLKSKLSQQNFASSIGYTSTMIGRVERSENFSSWDKIFFISQKLKVNYCNLFNLRTQEDLLKIVEESYILETKLNQEKKDYYEFLRKDIIRIFKLLAKNK